MANGRFRNVLILFLGAIHPPFVYRDGLGYANFMKILFVSPAMEEKSRGIGAIFRSLVESAKEDGHEVYILAGYPDSGKFLRSSVITDKLEHLYAQHYMKDGRDSFANIDKYKFSRRGILYAITGLSIFRSKTIGVNHDYLTGPKTILNNSDFVIKSPYFYFVLSYAPNFLTQLILNRLVRKNDIDLVIVSTPSVISSHKTPAKVAHFVHDAIPIEIMEAPFDNDTPRRYAKQFHSTCINSDLLFANSTDTAEKVTETNPKANVHVLYGTASSRREDLEAGTILKREGLKKDKFLLFTSTVEGRKNVARLIKAYAMIHGEIDMPLVIVGAPGHGFDEIEEAHKSLPKNVQKDVRFLGYVTEADKFQLFDNAFAFVLPSLYEGMGLMLIEAMQADTPIITSSRGALPEAGGDAALYIEDPYDENQIAEAILKLKNQPELSKQLIRAGREQQKKFTFEKFTERFSTAIKSLGTRKESPVIKESNFAMTAMNQLVFVNTTEIVILLAIFINQFNYWPTASFDGLGGFSLEISMLSGLMLVLRGLHVYKTKIIQALLRVPAFLFVYAWIVYGVGLGMLNSDSPQTIAVKGLYLLSIVAGTHVIATFYADKKISVGRIIKGWVIASVILAPLFILQYLLVALGVEDLSKRAYQVGIFEFPRLHGFSFEPLFLANWLLVPTIYAITMIRSNRSVATVLSLLIFLTLARGAIIALVVALIAYALVTRLGLKRLRYLFRPVVHGLSIALVLVAISSQINGTTALQGAFRYMDHLTLGVFNSSGAENISLVEVETSEGTKTIIDTKEIDKTGAVEASTVSRVEAVELGIEMFEDEPLTGVGMFRFGEAANEKYPEVYKDTDVVANAQPVDILAETGIVGIALLAALVVFARRQLLALSIPVLLLVALVIQYAFFTNLFLIPFWFILGVVLTGRVTKELRFG